MGRMAGIEREYNADTGRNILFDSNDLHYVNWLKEKIVSLENRLNKSIENSQLKECKCKNVVKVAHGYSCIECGKYIQPAT